LFFNVGVPVIVAPVPEFDRPSTLLPPAAVHEKVVPETLFGFVILIVKEEPEQTCVVVGALTVGV
jgi:hypothetical protein